MPVNQKPPDKFARYTDATGQLSNRSLKTGEWYVSHKIMLRNIVIGVLGVWCFLSVGYSIFAWGAYGVSGYFSDRALAKRQVSQFQNYAVAQEQYKALPLDLSSIQVYSGADGQYDFVALAKNNNQRFVVTVHYIFSYDGGQTLEQQTVILPMTTTPLTALGQLMDNYPGNPTLKIQKVSYERISPHQITNIKNYIAERTRFTVENVEFLPPQEGVTASRIKFDVINNTAYEFWEPFFYLEPLSGGGALGIMSTTVADFKPGERRTIEVATFIDVTGADDLRITPVMDIFDQSIYKKL